MTRDELTAKTLAAHINYVGGSWIADCEKRAAAVSEPAWQEICRLQKLLDDKPQRQEAKKMPKETEVQRQCREFWTTRLGASSVGWGRDKNGAFHAEFARHAEAAWIAAQAAKQ